jgi:hypothetical protein
VDASDTRIGSRLAWGFFLEKCSTYVRHEKGDQDKSGQDHVGYKFLDCYSKLRLDPAKYVYDEING